MPAFGDYVGHDYQTSTLDFTWIAPSQDSWNDGDHSVQCALIDPANEVLSESLKDSAR